MVFANSYTIGLLNASSQRLSSYKTALLVTAKVVVIAVAVQPACSPSGATTSTKG